MDKPKPFVMPTADTITAIKKELLTKATARQRVIKGGVSRQSFLRTIEKTIKKVKGCYLKDSEILEILSKHGVDISLATFRGFWTEANKEKDAKPVTAVDDNGAIAKPDGNNDTDNSAKATKPTIKARDRPNSGSDEIDNQNNTENDGESGDSKEFTIPKTGKNY